ncbi:hypothetical protein [Oceanicola granulosus]|uniref:hypothetical protein n=1 Tax=Oceanicola granulosus TaxID=252302 RepID=UPI0012EA3AD0|nr:hypothetical protein [Oceanicola granulosus]
MVFLEFPNLPFVTSDSRLEKSPRTASTLARSIHLASFVYRTGSDAELRLAEEEERDFSNARWSKKRSLARGWVNALYAEARVGDVVVVPGPGHRKMADGSWKLFPTLIGEIVGETERWAGAPYPYSQGRLLTRRVRWIPDAHEGQLSPRLALALRTQNALVRLPAGELEQVLGAAFKNVVLKNETLARFLTSNPEFHSYENYHFLSFIQATCAAFRSAEQRSELVGNSIFEIAGSMERDSEYVVEQDANIHSPGYSTLKVLFPDTGSRRAKNLPLIIACLFALAASPEASPFDADGSPNVNVSNSESPELDPCDPEFGLEKDVRDTLDAIGYDRWVNEWCPTARSAQENDGFEALPTVE